ncbi:MAG: hypothetical protein JRG76_01940 [Deltaproteobacteria bacterium]|nr:hypothetical protein [Deltaproteobacteria bacterium]MBW2413246.1 hypothetical protein [Deltaproteobacteria bacterium]
MRISKTPGEVTIGVAYGLGASCGGRFARRTVEGLSARQLVNRVIECRQVRGPASRTAAVVGEVLRSTRQIDIEVVQGSSATGQPISLDDTVVHGPGGDQKSDTDEYTIMISESYRGGGA